MRMSKSTLFSLLGTLLGLASCQPAEQAAPETRSFHLGFTPFPYAISWEAVQYTYATIGREADLICHSFDEGVPWVEALAGTPFSAHVQGDWDLRRSLTPPGHRVFVQVTPMNFWRNGLSLYRGTANDQPLPPDWQNARFSDQKVKQAYLNYCQRAIAFFRPDYFNFAIEVNLLLGNAPQLWADYLDLHQFVYRELKRAHPQLPIFCSLHAGYLLRGYEDRQDYDAQERAARELGPFMDIFGMSIYLYGTKFGTNSLPPDLFARIKALAGDKPLAVTETGYLAQDLYMGPPWNVTIASTAEKQRDYIEYLLRGANEYNLVLVSNFVLRDYDELWRSVGAQPDITALWRDTGLFDEAGRERPALAVWRRYLNLPKR
jgi:hypothetical protein